MTPENEQGVIVLFAQQAQAAGFEIVSIGGAFPDALVTRAGVTYRVEFEYQAASFKSHKHDVRKCDLVVCWVNDWPGCVLPVLALSEFGWPDTDLVLPGELERQSAYWELRALSAEARLRRIGDEKSKAALRSHGKTRQEAAAILAAMPDITGAELGRQLGKSERLGRLLKSELVPADGNGKGG